MFFQAIVICMVIILFFSARKAEKTNRKKLAFALYILLAVLCFVMLLKKYL